MYKPDTAFKKMHGHAVGCLTFSKALLRQIVGMIVPNVYVRTEFARPRPIAILAGDMRELGAFRVKSDLLVAWFEGVRTLH
jgi:hypothetical protein